DMAMRGGVSDVEKLALIEGKSGTAGLQALTGMLEKDASKLTGTNLRELAVKAGVTETATLDALASKSGQEGLTSLNSILTQSAGAPFRDATVPLAERLSPTQLREMAVAGGVTDAKALAAFEGKSGLEGLKTATALLTERTTAAQKAADTALSDAVRYAPVGGLQANTIKEMALAGGISDATALSTLEGKSGKAGLEALTG